MSESFYKTVATELILDDAFDAIKKIKSKSIDMIFADPPYFLSNNGVSCHSGKQVTVNKGDWDKGMSPIEKLKWNRRWLKLCRRVLKDNGSIWISGTFHNIYLIGVALELEGYSIINNITWQKPNPAPNLACRCFTNSTETVLWARKQLTPKKKGKHYFDYPLMKEENGGKQMKDVWVLPLPKKSEKEFGHHPTQKPVSLLTRIVLASTKENDLVLDPFCGSATTGVVCVDLKRKFIGIDNSEEYLKIAQKRLEKEKTLYEKRF
jgi:site-specific DNA-methyltransferase (adenine-specific)